MLISVVIPTYRRPGKIAACLRRLAAQENAEFEVLVGFDGPDAEGVHAAGEAWRGAGGRGECLHLIECPRSGLTAVRNRVLERARGDILLSLNDDVLAEPGFLEAHATAHGAALARDRRIIVSGSSPWVVHQPDRLFDRLVRETSMVFFQHTMDGPGAPGPEHDWGFRHCWGLNFSCLMDDARAVGLFTQFPAWYGYEDNEIAFKINRWRPTPVRYVPAARALHDHRMEPWEYLEREFKLGYAALGFAQTSPECARALFGRDVTESAEIEYSRAFVARERGGAARVLPGFLKLVETPADAVQGPYAAAMVEHAYFAHLPLKRWCWRSGLLAGHRGEPLDAAGAVRLLQ